MTWTAGVLLTATSKSFSPPYPDVRRAWHRQTSFTSGHGGQSRAKPQPILRHGPDKVLLGVDGWGENHRNNPKGT